jgi:hypothetical protein
MTTADLVKDAPVQPDRHSWARHGHRDYAGEGNVLAITVRDGNIDGAVEELDHWAIAANGPIEAVQRVRRKGIEVLYGRVRR